MNLLCIIIHLVFGIMVVCVDYSHAFYKCVDPETGDISFTNLGCPSNSKNTEIPDIDDSIDLSFKPIKRSDEELKRLISAEPNQNNNKSIRNKTYEDAKQINVPQAEKTGILKIVKEVPKQDKQSFTINYNTVVHEIFDEYQGAHTTRLIAKNKNLFDNMINNVVSELDLSAPHDYNSSRKRLWTIQRVVEQEYNNIKGTFFSEGDCKLTFLIYGIGEALGLPVNIVTVPGHVFMRYHFGNGRYVNWESLQSRAIPDSHFHRTKNLSQRKTAKGKQHYMRSLDRNESRGEALATLAFIYNEQKRWGLAERTINKALSYGVNSSFAYSVKGYNLTYQGRRAEGAQWYKKALALDVGNKSVRNNLKKYAKY